MRLLTLLLPLTSLLLAGCETPWRSIVENAGGRQGLEEIGVSGPWVLHAKSGSPHMVQFWRVTDIAGSGVIMTWKFEVSEEAWRGLRAGQVLTNDEVTRLRALMTEE